MKCSSTNHICVTLHIICACLWCFSLEIVHYDSKKTNSIVVSEANKQSEHKVLMGHSLMSEPPKRLRQVPVNKTTTLRRDAGHRVYISVYI